MPLLYCQRAKKRKIFNVGTAKSNAGIGLIFPGALPTRFVLEKEKKLRGLKGLFQMQP